MPKIEKNVSSEYQNFIIQKAHWKLHENDKNMMIKKFFGYALLSVNRQWLLLISFKYHINSTHISPFLSKQKAL